MREKIKKGGKSIVSRWGGEKLQKMKNMMELDPRMRLCQSDKSNLFYNYKKVERKVYTLVVTFGSTVQESPPRVPR